MKKAIWLVILVIGAAVLVILTLTVWFPWFNTYNWVPTFLLTVVLAASTVLYTLLTYHLAESSQQQTSTTREQLDLEKMPNLIFSDVYLIATGQTLADSQSVKLQCHLFNLGRYPIRLSQVVTYGDHDEILVNQLVTVLIGEAQEYKEPILLKTMQRNVEREEMKDGTKTPVHSQSAILSDEVLKTVTTVKIYYQYGATGSKIHSATIKKLVDTTTVEGQVQTFYLQGKVPLDDHNVSYCSKEGIVPPIISTWERL
jgi:hypothetical protein